MIFKFLANNLAIMLAMGLFYGLLIRKKSHHLVPYRQVGYGFFFGFAAIVTMQNSYVLRPGAIFDCRSVLLSVTGMFAGPITATTSVLIASVYRIWQGGVGAVTGVLVIVSTAGIGVVFYYLRQSRSYLTKPLYLYGFGLLVHVVMLLLMLTFPWDIAIQIFKTISLPVLALYPFGTALLGKVFADQEDRFNAEENIKKYNQNLKDNELRLQLAVQSGNVGLYDWNAQTNEIFYSPEWKHQIGYKDDEIENSYEEWEKRLHPEDREKTLELVRASLNSPPPGGYQAEFRLRHKDGSYRWIMTRGGFVYDDKQNPLRMLGAHIDVTERKQAEENWRTTFDAINDSICLLDPEWKVIRHNRMTETLLGKSAEEITGRHCYELVHGTRKPIPECPILRVQQSKHRESITLQLGNRWVEVLVDPVLDENNQIVQIVHVVKDITKRKQINETLRESEKKYRSLFDSMLNGFAYCEILLDENGRPIDYVYLEVNDAFENLTGLKKENVVGKKATEAIPGIKKAGVSLFEIFGNVALTGKEIQFDLLYEPLNGYFTISAYSPQKGYFVILFENITERKQAEQALHEKEAILEKTAHMGKIGGWEFDAKTREGAWTEEMSHIHDLDPGEKTNVEMGLSFYSGPYRDMIEAAVKEAIEQGKPYDLELEMTTAKGTRKWIRTIGEPVLENSTCVEVRGMLQDITMQKNIEQQLRASNQQLRASEQQLHNVMRTLESKNEELQDIVYVSSHDLKTPLVNISGFGNLLSAHFDQIKQVLENEPLDENVGKTIRHLLDEKIPEDLSFIIQSARKMNLLINGLLEISRAGTASLSLTQLDMNKLIRNIINHVACKAQQTDAEITVDTLDPCFGDPAQISQVFMNLIDNSLKYADPSRKPRIHISCTTKDRDNIYCVEDNGIGIHPEYHTKIFEIFHRLNPQGTAQGEGLGLVIIRRILDRHNGKIWLESTPGKGSKFFISLPNKEVS